ncbi:amino acid permease [Bradyrhizobium sp. SSBR45G]|uniref:APC family permease n=1 Tax=unclassified Bradyrhizobium TaxID=2631580 RepID=UPI0023429764|nr:MULTISPECIES: amino acid permease [unclassified Bradyrhizobium]GLH77827.1 amino acid permease [Bradyrhizobium sp. SSBR45G]GLH85552.1 amino acid permease [Bradyrhizobium sp. SSBR45R]
MAASEADDRTRAGRTSGAAIPSVSLPVAIAIVIADMIGVGVFTSLGFQVKDLPSGFAILALWAVGGLVSICGALSYAELGAMFPRSSGEYNFLTRAFHPAIGFMAGWVSSTVGFAAPVALAAMAFGEYGRAVLPGAPPMLLAIGAVWLVTAVQLGGIRQSSRFQLISTLLKLGLIVAFLVAGCTLSVPQAVRFMPAAADVGYIGSAAFATGLVFVMYAFSGWNAATYIIGELHTPERNLPRALLAGTLIVLVLYMALNAVFLRAAPMGELAGQLQVASIAGAHIFGETGGRFVAAMICIGLVPSIAAMMWIGPRVLMTMGEDIPALSVFARRSRNGAPAYAVLFQLTVATLMLFTGSFEAVLDLVQFALLSCSFLTVVGLFRLRIAMPDLKRPYRAWGYPLTPLIFLSVTGFMMFYLVTARPWQAGLGAVAMVSGLLIYWLAHGRSRRTAATAISGSD